MEQIIYDMLLIVLEHNLQMAGFLHLCWFTGGNNQQLGNNMENLLVHGFWFKGTCQPETMVLPIELIGVSCDYFIIIQFHVK